jgi:hypothetical protein
MHLRGAFASAFLAVAGLAIAGVPAAMADAGPFPCTSATDFISPKSQLYMLQDTTVGAPTNMTALASTSYTYNALAFDPGNNYLYAIAEPPNSPDLLRFDQNGSATDLGPVNGLSTAPGVQYVTGAFGFDSTGLMWVFSNSSNTTAYGIDPNTHAVVQTVALSAPVAAFDWAFHGGYMWALDDNVLYQVNLSDGQVLQQRISTGSGPFDEQFNSVWRFANGDLGFLANTGDVLARITVAPGDLNSPSNVLSTQVLSLPGASAGVNDGASCAPPPLPVTVTVTAINAVEGNQFSGTVATVTDPNTYEPASQYTATINWGDGSTTSGSVSGPTGGPFTVSGSHAYAEEGAYQVKVTVQNVDTLDHESGNSAANVSDAQLNGSCETASTSGQSFSGPTATFTDADPGGMSSDYTATIDWGDSSNSNGTVSSGSGSGPYTVTGSHNYGSTGPYTITTTITDAGSAQTIAKCQTLVYAFAPGGGAFVIGDHNSANGSNVTFWGAQWAKGNSLSGGVAPAAFKGFALNPSTPSCGVSWSTNPGNSAPPPSGPLPAYMAVIVSGHAAKSGSQISGDTEHIVVVQVKPGYQANPGHAGTGGVVAQVC